MNKLVIPAFTLAGQGGHWFNELLRFKNESLDLGLVPRIVVPRSTHEQLAAELGADRILDSLPELDVHAFVAATLAFADNLVSLRDWLDAERLDSSDLVYFPQGHPILIHGIGEWLSGRAADSRPAVFFRIIGNELRDIDTGRFRPRAELYRLASASLGNSQVEERVFFLVNSLAKARAISRVLRRRPFMMQHHFGRTPDAGPGADMENPTIYVHLNDRSGRSLASLPETIERVRASEPRARFLLKPSGEIAKQMAGLRLGDSLFDEILPAEMEEAEYLQALARSALVLLAYEAPPYRVLTSGVFTEATSLGKPVIVPEDTWMAEKMAEGYGVGLHFADPTAQSLADVILRGLRDRRQLAADARDLAPRLAEETGCRRFIETMIALSKSVPDMAPVYRIGDPIDFSDTLDCRDFMGSGWSETEPWGTWCLGSRAELSLKIGTIPDAPVFLHILAQAHLPPRRQSRVDVRVYCGTTPIAEWKFSSRDAKAGWPRWFSAPLPPAEQLGDLLKLSFEITGATSPYAEGLSKDKRLLGLGLIKLSISAAERAT